MKKSIIAFILLSFVSIIQSSCTTSRPGYLDSLIQESVTTVNKTCPMMLDTETRLDNLIALPQNSIQYNFTLVNTKSKEIDRNVFKKAIEPDVIKNIKENRSLKVFRDNNVTFQYHYKDKEGALVLKLSIGPDIYKN